MNTSFTALALAASLTAFSLPALAEQELDGNQPIKMNDGQMADVTAGALLKFRRRYVDTHRFFRVETNIALDVSARRLRVFESVERGPLAEAENISLADERYERKRHYKFKRKLHQRNLVRRLRIRS